MRYFDGHCDSASRMQQENEGLLKNHLHISLEKAKHFTAYGQLFAIFISDSEREGRASERFFKTYDYFLKELSKNKDRLRLIEEKEDYEYAERKGLVKAFLTIENGAAFGGDLGNVEKFNDLGIKLVTITWNGENELGFGCKEESSCGLKPFGKQCLEIFKERNMFADVSHLNEAGFFDVIESGCLVMATHSNSAAVHNHKRNLTDGQFKAIMANGGGVGVNFYPDFLGHGEDIDAIVLHIEHFLALGGKDHVFIGADFDGISKTPRGLRNIGDVNKLYERLFRLNYSEDLLDLIFYRNLERLMQKTL